LRRSVRRGWLGTYELFLVLRWMTLEKVLKVSVVSFWFYLAANALGVGPARHCVVLSLQAWIFGGELTVHVPAVPVMEAPRCGSREPRRVPSRVTRLGHNRRPSVPWVQDPYSSPRAFRRAGGWSCLLDEMQNRYSQVTTGTIVGSSHDHGVSWYDWSWDVPSF
jgi:hypothetical protein